MVVAAATLLLSVGLRPHVHHIIHGESNCTGRRSNRPRGTLTSKAVLDASLPTHARFIALARSYKHRFDQKRVEAGRRADMLAPFLNASEPWASVFEAVQQKAHVLHVLEWCRPGSYAALASHQKRRT